MKKLFFLLAVALPCLIITSCGDDDDKALISSKLSEQQGELNGHEWIDLGLSVKWATCNVGASVPEDYGDYFAWGETKSKKTYNWSTYKYSYASTHLFTKYCASTSNGYNGFVDNKTTLDPADDAATTNWGTGWRMPTDEEQRELYRKCTCIWTTQNGVSGYKVTGPNGRSIFLPAAGTLEESSLKNVGSSGEFWSATYSSGSAAYCLSAGINYTGWNNNGRCYGLSVRPVCQ